MNEKNVFTGLHWKDKLMKYYYESYPEVLMVDATYKLNQLRMPLYLMLIVDGLGQSEIVSVFLTSTKTKVATSYMVASFKAANPSLSKTGVIITDKDFTERAVFAEEFPDASLHICLFHALRSMRREVTCEKLGLRPGERDYVLELLAKLVYAVSEEEYEKHYNTLMENSSHSVKTYYNSNWHSIRYEWAECFKSTSYTLGERTNNRLESINSKIKSVCSRFASLSRFFDEFLAVLSSLRNERDHNTVMALVKKVVVSESSTKEEEMFYSTLLTPYALHLVINQLHLHKNVSFVDEKDDKYIVSSSSGK